jgi:RimJ/RimL family protein N-acetyltransferase
VPGLVEPYLPAGALARLAQPVLERDRLRLRPWRDADGPAVVQAYADPAIQRWHVKTMTPAEALAWVRAWRGQWREESGASWAVVGSGDPDDGSELLGQVGLRRLSLGDGLAGLSYWVMPAARGRGVARRAVEGLSAWAFGQLGLHRIEIEHSTSNPASCAVATAAGFAAEGVKRGEGWHADGWHDMHLHARLRTDG